MTFHRLPLCMIVLVITTIVHLGRVMAGFTGMGDLPPSGAGQFTSEALGVSYDGSVVSGKSSSSPGTEAASWTSGGGIVGIGWIPGGVSTYAIGFNVSKDGQVIAGNSTTPSGPFSEAFRWTSGSGLVALGDLGGGTFDSGSYSLSSNGSVVVGYGTSASGHEAMRWTSGTGMVGLGDFAGGSYNSEARDVSNDGSVTVGYGSAAVENAFRWTSGTGMVAITAAYSRAYAVSGDGNIITGFADLGSGIEAFRWTSVTGAIGLGQVAGSTLTWGYDINDGGNLIVGYATVGGNDLAMIWENGRGMRLLSDVLTNDFGLGSAISGWTLQYATGISGDGTTIVGFGIDPSGNTQGWIFSVPEPSSYALLVLGMLIPLCALKRRGAQARPALSQT